MNRAYSSAGIAFRLLSIDRVINATWASNGDDSAMRQALRNGTYDELNVYVQSNFQSGTSTPGIPAGSILLGLGTPAVLRSSCITGGSLEGYNTGYILTHETGHWAGLYHTFQGDTCDGDDYGDFVFDTPQQSVQGRDCPSSQDSCPDSGYTYQSPISLTPWSPQGLAGPDPINNYMDYTNEYCSTTFTPAQGLRIFNVIQLLRNGA
ncbi:hypothetical protein AMS68_002032 [Peltaster fructicola]|uniref:Peptidase M43 pregnancy-associated plasma-A domain-containing protein n=1 Tax=Peltaster fructicola TaxID=286661 RepID=A0A6H0XPF5_9PEZI|nr:hypothetical protein AMS68_002032 [Peltaster fructicola]